MYITVKTVVGFDPNTEQEEIRAFQEKNDMTKWRVSDYITEIVFTQKYGYIFGAEKEG